METVYSRLRQWRGTLARELNVPPFFILSNAHLAKVSLARPTTLDELSACPGVGPKKLAQFGAELLVIVADATSEGLEPGVVDPQVEPEAPLSLSEADVAEIMAGLRQELARQVARRFKGRYSATQVESVLARFNLSA